MKKRTAFVLSGGGSRGALQAGALRALLEAGIVPDLVVGTSIGAVNAAALALWGADLVGVSLLESAWQGIADVPVLDTRISLLALRTLLGRPSDRTRKKVEEMLISYGFGPELRFGQLPGVRLALISADLGTGQPVIHGQNPSDSVLEGLLSSIAIPPWFALRAREGRLIMDGGALSNVPIEPALRLGAQEIIVLDLGDDSLIPREALTLAQYAEQFVYAIGRRHMSLELALAEARGVPVRCLDFRGLATKPIWDFSDAQAMTQAGYERARSQIALWGSTAQDHPGMVPIPGSVMELG